MFSIGKSENPLLNQPHCSEIIQAGPRTVVLHFDEAGNIKQTTQAPEGLFITTIDAFGHWLKQDGWVIAHKGQLEEILLEKIADGSLGMTADKIYEFMAAAIHRLDPTQNRVLITLGQNGLRGPIPDDAFIVRPRDMPDVIRKYNCFWSEDLERIVLEATRKLATKAALQEF